ncbi:MAG: hypothetical protein Q9M41_08420 [Paracoccaceae bacterium]|nr:hypothetical protein [Paracoccaceae bacterium]
MKRLALVLACALMLPLPALAGDFWIRSGSGGNNQNLVVGMPSNTRWRVSWNENGYVLAFDPPPAMLDLSAVQPRAAGDQRPTVALAGPGKLFLVPGKKKHLTTKQVLPGLLVLEFDEGPPRQEPWGTFKQVKNNATADGAELHHAKNESLQQPEKTSHRKSVQGLLKPDIGIVMLRAEIEKSMKTAFDEGLLEAAPDGLAEHSAAGNSETSFGAAGAKPAFTGNIRIRSVFDTFKHRVRAEQRHTTKSCPSNEVFKLPFPEDRKHDDAGALSRLRADIFGEFDKIDPEKFTALVRFQISRRLGVEAAALLRSHPGIAPHQDILLDMASLVEGGGMPSNGTLRQFIHCPGDASVWALAAQSIAHARGLMIPDGLAPTFSKMPGGLRHILGPIIAEGLVEHGKLRMAGKIIAMTARAPGREDDRFQLVRAKLNLKRRKWNAGLEVLEKIAKTRTPSAPEAMALVLETRLETGMDIPPHLLDLAQALAFQTRFAKIGRRLKRAEILAHAGAQHQERAFEEVLHEKQIGNFDERLAADIIAGIFLSFDPKRRSSAELARVYFRYRNLLTSDPGMDKARRHLAMVLYSTLPATTLKLLDPLKNREVAGDILLKARAFLENDQPRQAIAALKGLDSAPAREIRRQAFERIGRYDEALDQSLKHTPQDKTVQQTAWRAGRWDIVKNAHDKLSRDAARYIAGPGASRDGSVLARHLRAPQKLRLSKLRKILKDSQESRRQIDELLKKYPAP